MPLRERNELLLAAGYALQLRGAIARGSRAGPARDALGRVLAAHEPFPAFAIDRRWDLVVSNARARCRCSMAWSRQLLTPPANAPGSPSTPRGWPRGSSTSPSAAPICSSGSCRQPRVTADPGSRC